MYARVTTKAVVNDKTMVHGECLSCCEVSDSGNDITNAGHKQNDGKNPRQRRSSKTRAKAGSNAAREETGMVRELSGAVDSRKNSPVCKGEDCCAVYSTNSVVAESIHDG